MLQMLFRLNDCPDSEYVVDFRQTFSTICASEYVRSSFFIVAHIYILVQYLWALFWTFKSQAAQAVQVNMIEGQSPFRGVLDQVWHLHLQIVFSQCWFLFENSLPPFNAMYYITGWSKETVDCKSRLTDSQISKSVITQWFLVILYR